jgi:hypothetical protein
MNDLDTATGERPYKRHATLRAQAAILGFELIKSDPEICKQAPYYLYRFDTAKPFKDLDAVLEHLERLNDKLDAPAHHGQEL